MLVFRSALKGGSCLAIGVFGLAACASAQSPDVLPSEDCHAASLIRSRFFGDRASGGPGQLCHGIDAQDDHRGLVSRPPC